jgi:hypothetical protein
MTAVECYNLKVIDLMKQREQGKIDAINFRNELDQVFVRVKEMEKQQMKMAQMHYSSDVVGFKTLLENQFEGWYNQTFKSE